MASFILQVVLILCNLIYVISFAIDNEVVGIPQVTCSEDAVTFSVRSRNPFTGNIYIKGKYNDPTCRQEFFSNTYNGASLTTRIPLCGMRRIRQLQPQGMNYILVFVVNFHPQFVTKVDRAYNVRCFYAQQEKTVTSQLEVSMLATQSLEAATMLMPNCEYSIRTDTLNGPRVRYSLVGTRLVHRWECDNPNFGMLVKNCFVNDGYGSSVRVLDSRGCPVFTPVIQGALQYDNSLNLAYVEVWAYKFPDRQDLFFQCQIQVCNKRENECVGVTPPNCPLIPKTSFTPSSVIDPGLGGGFGVTLVRGTFPEVGGQLVVGYPYTPYPYTQGYLYPGNIAVRPVQAVGGAQAVLNNQAADTSYTAGASPVKQEQQYQETRYPSAVTNFPQAKPFNVQQQNGQQAQNQQLPTFGSQFVTSSLQEFITPKSFFLGQERGKKVARRQAAEKAVNQQQDEKKPFPSTSETHVMDVTSEVVYVADVTEANDDLSRLGRQGLNSDQRQICLNPMALSVLLICFAILVLIIALLLVYLLSKSNRLKTANWPSWSSLISIDRLRSSKKLPCLSLSSSTASRDFRQENST